MPSCRGQSVVVVGATVKGITMLSYDAHALSLREQQDEGYFGVYYWHNPHQPAEFDDGHDWSDNQLASYHNDGAQASVQDKGVLDASAYLMSCAHQEELQKIFAWEAPTPELLDIVAHVVTDCWETSAGYEQLEDLRHLIAFVVSEMDVCMWGVYAAMAYMFRLKNKFDESAIQTQNCSAQLFAVSLMMATKYLYDIPFSNAQWASTTQLDHKHLNNMEIELLDALGYSMAVEEAELAIIRHHMDAYAMSLAATVAPHHHSSPDLPLHPIVPASSPLGGNNVGVAPVSPMRMVRHLSPEHHQGYHDVAHMHAESLPCSACHSPTAALVAVDASGHVISMSSSPANEYGNTMSSPPANEYGNMAGAVAGQYGDWATMVASSGAHAVSGSCSAGGGGRTGYRSGGYTPRMQPGSAPSLVPNLLPTMHGHHHHHPLSSSSAYLVPQLVPDDVTAAAANGGFVDVTSGATIGNGCAAEVGAGSDPFSLFHYGPVSPDDVISHQYYHHDQPLLQYARQYPSSQPMVGMMQYDDSNANTIAYPDRYLTDNSNANTIAYPDRYLTGDSNGNTANTITYPDRYLTGDSNGNTANTITYPDRYLTDNSNGNTITYPDRYLTANEQEEAEQLAQQRQRLRSTAAHQQHRISCAAVPGSSSATGAASAYVPMPVPVQIQMTQQYHSQHHQFLPHHLHHHHQHPSAVVPAPMYAPAHCLPHPAWAAQPAHFSFFTHAAY